MSKVTKAKPLQVYSKVWCRGETSTSSFTISRELIAQAQALQGADDDVIDDLLESEEILALGNDVWGLLREITISDQDVLAAIDKDGQVGFECEEVTYGIGTTKTKAKVAFAEVYVD